MKNLSIPLAIVVAGFLVSGAIIFSNSMDSKKNANSATGGNVDNSADNIENTDAMDNIKPVSADDHIRGSLEGEVVVVEFSDFQCPFCQSFHSTMVRVIDDYNGRVAWVYRHFPLDSIHPKARKQAQGAECVAELGGNDAFWAYADKIFSGQNPELSQLSSIAQSVGLSSSSFQSCLDSGKYDAEVAKDLNDATASGGNGTPYSVVISKNGSKYVINGAQPYEVVKQIIDDALGI